MTTPITSYQNQNIDQSYTNLLTNKTLDNIETLNQTDKNTDSFHKQAKETAKQFEAMFMSQMINNMFSGLETDGYFGGGHSEEIFRGLMVTEYGKGIAEQGKLGIAEQVYREIIQLQESADSRGQ